MYIAYIIFGTVLVISFITGIIISRKEHKASKKTLSDGEIL